MAAGLAACAQVCLGSQTLDRVVASIGDEAITASEVEQEYRFERFLDGQWPPPPPDAAALASAREHLTYQAVLAREENPGPAEKAASEKDAAARLAELRKDYGAPETFQHALAELGMSEPDLLARLAQQELVLRFIDQRLRPAASPSDEDVAAYYRSTFAPEFQRKNHGAAPPPLSEVEAQIRKVLVETRINQLLDEWIGELQPSDRVRVHSF